MVGNAGASLLIWEPSKNDPRGELRASGVLRRCVPPPIYRLFTACGRAKKCVSRQYRRKRLGACGAGQREVFAQAFRIEGFWQPPCSTHTQLQNRDIGSDAADLHQKKERLSGLTPSPI
jgi:hypothetical protein